MLALNTKYYHAEELAEFLGCPPELIYWIIEKGALSPTWEYKEPWFPKESLDQLFTELNLTPQLTKTKQDL